MIHDTAQNIKYIPDYIELNLSQDNLNQTHDKETLNSFLLNQVQGRFALVPDVKDIPTLLYVYEVLKENIRGLAVKHIQNIEIFNNEMEDILLPENHNTKLIEFYDQLITTSLNLDSFEKIEELNLNLSEIWSFKDSNENILNSVMQSFNEISPKLRKAKTLNITGEAPAVFVLFLMKIISYQVSEIYYQLNNSSERIKIR